MSLIHLLSVGRSLKKSKDQTGVYRERMALPRFDAGSTLPATPTLPESRSLVTSQPSLFSRLVAAPTEEELSVGAQDKRAATPAAAAPKPAVAASPRPVAAPAPTAAPLSPVVPAPRKEAKWKSMIKALFGIRSKPVERRVQIELSLDRVTVVRNDLSDSDLEVVQRRPQSADTTPQMSFERRQTQSWMKLTKRLFQPGNGTAPAASARRSPFAASQPAPDLISRS